MPFDKLPSSFNTPKGFYNSSNNDVVPKIIPGYPIPLGYEYGAPYRYDRVAEVLGAPRKFAVSDLEKLQQDVVSIPAREMVPLLRKVKTADPDLRQAIARLLAWNFAMERESDAATIYEFWMLKLAPLAYAPRLPDAARGSLRQYDISQVIAWMKAPDAAYGANARARRRPATRCCSRRSARDSPRSASASDRTPGSGSGATCTRPISSIRWRRQPTRSASSRWIPFAGVVTPTPS